MGVVLVHSYITEDLKNVCLESNTAKTSALRVIRCLLLFVLPLRVRISSISFRGLCVFRVWFVNSTFSSSAKRVYCQSLPNSRKHRPPRPQTVRFNKYVSLARLKKMVGSLLTIVGTPYPLIKTRATSPQTRQGDRLPIGNNLDHRIPTGVCQGHHLSAGDDQVLLWASC